MDDNLTIIGEDETATREFLEVYFRDMGPPDGEITVYIGQMPDTADIMLPEIDATVIGGIQREGSYENTEIIYRSADDIDALEMFFEAEFADLGWEKIGTGFQPRGFVVVDQSYSDYCNVEADKSINIGLRGVDNETIIRINLNPADPYMCNSQINMEEAYLNDPYMRIPELSNPEGVTIQQNRGGGGGGGYPGTMFSANSTWLSSDVLSLTELMDAYNQQLVDSEWELVTNETNEHSGLSLWTFTDGDSQWNGYFSLMGNPTDEVRFYATIMVEEAGE